MKVAEVEPSGRIVLGCVCGERFVLFGREEDWRGEGRFAFRCGASLVVGVPSVPLLLGPSRTWDAVMGAA